MFFKHTFSSSQLTLEQLTTVWLESAAALCSLPGLSSLPESFCCKVRSQWLQPGRQTSGVRPLVSASKATSLSAMPTRWRLWMEEAFQSAGFPAFFLPRLTSCLEDTYMARSWRNYSGLTAQRGGLWGFRSAPFSEGYWYLCQVYVMV